MKLIVNPFSDCYHNIASEEYLCDAFDDAIFLLYINQPSIIVGRNQNSYAEINQQYVAANDIAVVRRLSGGGAVYHDGGNLNFSFIVHKPDKSPDELFREFTKPVLNVLNDMGINAVFSGRNDLTIDGKKFSGNAQFHKKERVAIHGTLLFDCDLTVLSNALQVNEIKFVDKAVKSVRSRVTNIKPYTSQDFSMEQFVNAIAEGVERQFDNFERYQYSAHDLAEIDKLVDQKYGRRDWNFGKSPKFEFTQRFRYQKGTVEFNANVEGGTIKDAKIYGDFFGLKPDLSELEAALVGCEFKPQAIKEAVTAACIGNYMDGLDADTFVTALFN